MSLLLHVIRGGLRVSKVRFAVVNVDGFSPARQPQPAAAQLEEAGLEISLKMTSQLDILKAVDTGTESCGDANCPSRDAESLGHCREWTGEESAVT